MITSRYVTSDEIDSGDADCDGCDNVSTVVVTLENANKSTSVWVCDACRRELIAFLTPPGGEKPKKKR